MAEKDGSLGDSFSGGNLPTERNDTLKSGYSEPAENVVSPGLVSSGETQPGGVGDPNESGQL